jgi:hypothetical protein
MKDEILGQANWDNFKNAIEKAKVSCENADVSVADHFAIQIRNRVHACPRLAVKSVKTHSPVTWMTASPFGQKRIMDGRMHTIDYLLQNSNLPGPRGNLELLYDFSRNADTEIVRKCLEYITTDTSNSPEEFVGMCGILGYAQINKDRNKAVLAFLRKYASHDSWRIREAVAMSIQEISVNNIGETLENIKPWIEGNFLEQRAVVAGLCEPKLLNNEINNINILKILEKITQNISHDNKLSDQEVSLRKALGYGWSVVIVSTPKNGKKYFEKLFHLSGKHVSWVIKENLKKNRLIKMDSEWVKKCGSRLASVNDL